RKEYTPAFSACLMSSTQHQHLKGYNYAITAMALWGAFPVYWKWLQTVDTIEVLAHRTIWCALFTLLVLYQQKRLTLDLLLVRPVREWLVLTASAVMIACNWGLFIWAVHHDFAIEASMGYFLSPLVSIMLGWLVFREQLRALHWIAIFLAAIGVLVQIISVGATPWLGLMISMSFATYGALRKFASADSMTGLLIETLILTPAAIAYLIWLEVAGGGMSFIFAGPGLTFLLLMSGVVTAVPLMLYVASTRLLALSVVGFLFYINPTLQFLIGRFIFGEPFSGGQLAGFALIWLGLLIFTAESLRRRKRNGVRQRIA
ncbi:MAG: EamA family transporter RarD, partial [Gammaproteobacteria bacterium]|nr:EamA family transporter RarD [Gammaproteobacteria bacterium]